MIAKIINFFSPLSKIILVLSLGAFAYAEFGILPQIKTETTLPNYHATSTSNVRVAGETDTRPSNQNPPENSFNIPLPPEFNNYNLPWQNQVISLGKDSIGSWEIVRHTIEAEDIDSNSITSRTIKNHTIKGKDINENADLTIGSLDVSGNSTLNNLNVTGTVNGTLSGSFIPTGDLDMSNYLITNIGNTGTDFTSTGGLNLAGSLNVGGDILPSVAGTLTTNSFATIGTGSMNSITKGSDGYPRIVYYDTDDSDLNFVQCLDADCDSSTISTVDSTDDVGINPSVGISSRDNYARIVYYDTTNETLKFIQCLNDSCSSATSPTTIDSFTYDDEYFATSLVMGTDGYARIAYTTAPWGDGDVRYIECSNDDCSDNTLTTVLTTDGSTAGPGISLALDTSNNPYIAYKAGGGGGGATKIARFVGGGAGVNCTDADWTCTTAASKGSFASIKIASDGLPRIAYMYGTGETTLVLNYATCLNAGCTNKTVQTIDVSTTFGVQPRLVINSENLPRIVYYDDDNEKLKFAACTTEDCSSATANEITNIGLDAWLSVYGLVLDDNGYAMISYADNDNTLKFVHLGSDDGSSVVTGVNIGSLAVPFGEIYTEQMYAEQMYLNGTLLTPSPWITSGDNIFYNTGNVGIGTNAPQTKLELYQASQGNTTMPLLLTNPSHVNDNTTVGMGFNVGGVAKGGIFYYRSGIYGLGDFYFANNQIADNSTVVGVSDVKMVIKNGGNVGIGTTAPEAKLHIRETGDQSSLWLDIDSADSSWLTLSDSREGYERTWSINTLTPNDAVAGNFAIRDETADETRFFIDASGNVGIGTTDPGGSRLELVGSMDDEIDALGLTRGTGSWWIGPASGTGDQTLFGFFDRVEEETRLVIDASGNVGIGTTAPGGKLAIELDSSAGDFCETENWVVIGETESCINNQESEARHLLLGYNMTGNYGSIFSDHTNFGTTPLVLQEFGGNVGIGTTAPSAPLTVQNSEDEVGIRIIGAGGDGESVSNLEFIDSDGETVRAYLGDINTGDNNFRIVAGVGSKLFLGANYESEFFVIDTNGNVGIGTADPQKKLEINDADSNTTTSGLRFTNFACSGTDKLYVGAGGDLACGTDQLGGGTGNIVDTLAQTLGAANDANALDITNLGKLYTEIGLVDSPTYSFQADTDTGLWSSAANILNFSTGGSERMRITSDGFVGIGTVDPEESFHFIGERALFNSLMIGEGDETYTTIEPREDKNLYIGSQDVDGGGIWLENLSGNIGIGTTAPDRLLSVAGDSHFFTTDSTTDFYLWTGADNLVEFNYGTGDDLQFLADDTVEVMRMTSAGNVGIGTTGPGYKLDTQADAASSYAASFFNDGANVNRYGIRVQTGADDCSTTGTCNFIDFFDGDATASGGIRIVNGTVAAYSPSDKRLKTNISDTVTNGLGIISGLRVVDFRRNSGGDLGPLQTGFIAQEAQNVFPNMVSSSPDGYLAISDSLLMPVVVKAIQEQQTEITGISLASQDLAQRDNDIISQINLNLNGNAQTIAELETDINEELTIIGGKLDELTAENISLNTKIADINNQLLSLTTLQSQIDEIKAQTNQDLNLAQIEANTEDISLIRMVLGMDRVTNPGDVDILGQIEAEGVVAGVFTVKVVDEESPTIGTCVAAKNIDEETCAIKEDASSSEIKTKAVNKDSKIYLTPIGSTDNQVLYVGKITAGEKFQVKIDRLEEITPRVVEFNWWIVETK